jgi:hypothetical protein
MKKFLLFTFGLLSMFGGILFFPSSTFAQNSTPPPTSSSEAKIQQDPIRRGVLVLENDTGLPTEDLRVVFIKFLRLGLSFLGAFVFILIIYAGFLWMVSAGDDEKRGEAKKTILNAVIGLIIIMCSYSIVNFLFNTVLSPSANSSDPANHL